MSRLNHSKLLIVPHSILEGAEDCCGCLIVIEREYDADLVCNECDALIVTVPVEEVSRTLMLMAMANGMLSATCEHCGALNTFPGFTSIDAFLCRECGQSVMIKRNIQ